MKYAKLVIALMTVVLLLLAAGIREMKPEPMPDTEVKMPLFATVEMGGQQERIDCWKDNAGNYVLFIPSGVALSDVALLPQKDTTVVLNQMPLRDALDCSDFQLDTPYTLSCTTANVTTEHSLIFLQSAQLPALYLDVQSGNMDLIHETKGNQESGKGRLYSQTGELIWSGQMESLRGRGNTSWRNDKKPYSLTLAREANLLDMGEAREWILLANALDPSHLRNKAVYDLAAKAGMAYTPECSWVDLYLNGDYVGLYLLSERNEIHPQRVNLPEAGSFLVSRESKWRLIEQNYPHIIMDSGAALRIHDSGMTEEDLRRIWQPAENAILASDGRDPVTGKSWQELIDLDSWVKDYLVGEIFGNVDGGIVSTFFYRDGNDSAGKIYAGPIWDYDLTMGTKGTWQTKYVQAFFVDRAHVWRLEDTTWAFGLNQKPEFQARVRELYKELLRPLLQELLDTELDAYAKQIHQGTLLDQRRWGSGSAREETEFIRRYMTERLAFLDSVWLEGTQYCKVLVMYNEHASAFCHAVLPGETIPELPDYEEAWDILGWYDASTEQPFDPEQPIYEDTVVYLKKLPGEEDQISPLQALPIAAALGILGILVMADRKHRRIQAAKKKKSIAKQKIV